jgi:nucleoporin NUP159
MSLLGPTGFTLGSTFRPNESTKDEDPRLSNGGGIFFGSKFGTVLGETQKTTVAATLEPNEAGISAEEHYSSQKATSPTIPVSTPAVPKFQFPNPVLPVKGGLFGTSMESSSTIIGTAKPISANSGTSVTDGNIPEVSSTQKPMSILQFPLTPEAPKIKQEPQSDEKSESITGIPEAPLAPDTTSKTSYTAGESSVSSAEPDAPLPPDFVPTGLLSKTEALKGPSSETKKKDSIPSDLIPPSNVPDGPEEEDSDFITEEGDSPSENQSEGSGEDIAKDDSPVSDSQQIPGLTPQSSFGGAHRAAGSTMFTKISRPVQDPKPRSLFGEIGSRTAPKLPPPPAKQLSPRSPSPVRASISSRLRPEAPRSVSAPGVASQLLGSQRLSINRPPHVPGSVFAISLEQKKAEDRRQAEIKARKEAEESQALIDEEDDAIQRFLQREIIGSKSLDDFVAHRDYVCNADKDSIPAQVETVYRDISSMIDTLGTNSCALKSFIKGHTEQYKRPCRNREDLEGNDEWCLVEIESLSNLVERALTEQLDQGRIKDVIDKLQACVDLEKDLVKLRAKHDDTKALLTSRLDHDHLVIARSLPLTVEQATQQHDLRKDYTKFRKLLTEAEEGLILLRAKLVSHTGMNRRAAAGPTVEAVVRTITKMTTMAEKRSGDIDVLENQMRKLRFGSTISSGSREGSPFTTPAKPSTRNPGTSSTYGLLYTPDCVKDTPRGIHTSMMSSTHSYGRGTPPRKKISGFTDDEKLRLKAHATRRKGVTDKLNTALQTCGTRILLMDDQ